MTNLTVSGGVRDESRKVDSYWAHGDDTSYEHVTTDQTAFWVVAGWRPTKRLNFSAEIEDASYDNPYTSASPTDRSRYRLRLRYNQDKGLWVGGSYVGSRFENKNSGWDANYDQFDIHAGYHAESVDAAVGYNNIQIERSIDQQVTAGGGGFLFPVFYDADADFVDGRVRWTANQRFALGGDFRLYENTGSFGVDRTDYRGWIEIGFLQNYLVHLGYRTVDYKQSNYSVDDYDADIAEISVGYRW